MNENNNFLSKEDYEEPCCPLKMDINKTVMSIPVGRVLAKLDEHLGRNDYVSAENLLNYWHEEAKIGGDIRGELTILNEKVGIYRKTQKMEKCFSAINESLSLVQNSEFENTVTKGTTFLNCATGYCDFDRYDDALPLYRRAAEVFEKYLNKPDYRLGGLYNNTAVCLMNLKKYDESRELFQKALKIMPNLPNSEGEMATSYCNMADLEAAEKGMEGAEEKINEYLEKAEELLNTPSLPRDGDYAYICEKCAGTFGYYGFFMTERELLNRAREIYARN